MYKNYESDMIYIIILDHFNQTGNLDPDEIKSKVLTERITISLSSVKSRIDEFKRTQAYKNHSKDNKAP
jgi:hypothetical protein